MLGPTDKKETEYDKYPEQVRNDHDGLPRKTIGDNSRCGAKKSGRDKFGD